MRIRQIVTVALAVVALGLAGLALAACSGSTAATPSEAPPSAGAGTPASSPATPSTAVTPSTPSTAPAGLLTPADVEKVSSFTGIKVVPRDPSKGAGGQVNLATADGKLVVMATFGKGADYGWMKSSLSYRESLSGLGDTAFVGPSKNVMPVLYIVGFKKGDHAAILNTYF